MTQRICDAENIMGSRRRWVHYADPCDLGLCKRKKWWAKEQNTPTLEVFCFVFVLFCFFLPSQSLFLFTTYIIRIRCFTGKSTSVCTPFKLTDIQYVTTKCMPDLSKHILWLFLWETRCRASYSRLSLLESWTVKISFMFFIHAFCDNSEPPTRSSAAAFDYGWS